MPAPAVVREPKWIIPGIKNVKEAAEGMLWDKTPAPNWSVGKPAVEAKCVHAGTPAMINYSFSCLLRYGLVNLC